MIAFEKAGRDTNSQPGSELENAMHRSSFVVLFRMGLAPTGNAQDQAWATLRVRTITWYPSSVRGRRHRRLDDLPGSFRSVGLAPLRATLGALMFGISLVATTEVAVSHHSVAMFDRDHPIQLIGVVREFKFVNPHASIALEVTSKDASSVIWNLEGDSTNSLKWDGWSSQTLKPGDEVRLTVEPLRSGAPGGVWHARSTTYKDGAPIVVTHQK